MIGTTKTVTRKARNVLMVFVGSLCLTGAAVAAPSQPFTVASRFTPYRLGASTNLSAQAIFGAPGAIPLPATNIVGYGPSGLTVNVSGTDTCERRLLEQEGPAGCPPDSRLGFGGGTALVALGGQIVKSSFTLDFFLAPRQAGRLSFLIYVDAVSPVPLELVLTGREVQGQRPYGFGVAVELPLIATVPGASDASGQSAFFTLGDQHIAYYHEVRSKQQLVHVKGIVLPKTCRAPGLPFTYTVGFSDGTSSTDDFTMACPRS
jgi:hypothetical protein